MYQFLVPLLQAFGGRTRYFWEKLIIIKWSNDYWQLTACASPLPSITTGRGKTLISGVSAPSETQSCLHFMCSLIYHRRNLIIIYLYSFQENLNQKISREKQVKNFLLKWLSCVLSTILQGNEIFLWNTIVEQKTQSRNIIIIWSGSHELFVFPVVINLSQELSLSEPLETSSPQNAHRMMQRSKA